jgi:hypothetical protein
MPSIVLASNGGDQALAYVMACRLPALPDSFAPAAELVCRAAAQPVAVAANGRPLVASFSVRPSAHHMSRRPYSRFFYAL